MSKEALWAVGLAAGVGIALAVRHANASDPTGEGSSDSDEPLPAPGEATATGGPPGSGEQGSGGGPEGAGSGAPEDEAPTPEPIPDPLPEPLPEHQDLLPLELSNINLSGNEVITYTGPVNVDPAAAGDVGAAHTFDSWRVDNSLNGMPIFIYVSQEFPNEWISAFLHQDPPGSSPPEHFILYFGSDTPGKYWMQKYIFKMPVSSGPAPTGHQ